ncbi:MAG: hypothetical protein MPJ22_09320, partial [Pirellulales bacterium]|nr:hypothetical protein [Pirellulales bacterium]
HPGNFRNVFGFEGAPDSTSLPDVYENEIGIYGNRGVSGLLRMVGAEKPTLSQQFIWGEEGRLHVYCDRARRADAAATTVTINLNGGSTTTVTADTNHSFRVGDVVIIGDGSVSYPAYVTAAAEGGSTITLASYDDVVSSDGGFAGLASGTSNLTVLVVGNESGKGSDSRNATIQPEYTRRANTTVTIRETYNINGSDMSQIGWLKIDGSPYWYQKGDSEAMKRWMDYMETHLVEAKATQSSTNNNASTAGRTGTEGLFDAVMTGGNVADGGFSTSGTATDGLACFDSLLQQWDREGAIEENVLFLDRAQSLRVDNILATQNSYGTGGTSWGLFNNSEEMGINLGFRSWRRGSYDFYKKDWKYLNQTDGRGSFADIQGVSIPMGSKNVYDQMGEKVMEPYLCAKYLESPQQSRKAQSWAHGGTPQGGYVNGLDQLSVEHLTERGLMVAGRNNFFIFTA